MRVRFIVHALGRESERIVRRDDVERVLAAPIRVEADPRYPHRTRVYRRIPEFGNRVLRVVYEIEDGDILVVTVLWDRNAGRRL